MSVSPALLAGRYRLREALGTGGMGRVWLARDEVLHRDVAVKEVALPPALTQQERDELQFRTMREARTTARLSHPNVVQIYDVLDIEDRPWIVMEYIRSRSLQQILNTDGPVSPRRAAEIGLAVLAALVAAHRAGVLHRDVKPGNVLIADDGRVVLTDFGLAIFDGGEGSVTRPGLVWGSPEYVAPERAKHGTSSVEADLWSLGATLFTLVEGSSPYARSSAMASLTALATEKPPIPQHAGALKPVLTGLLRKDPRARLRPAELERALRRAAEPDGRPRGPRPPRPRRLPWTTSHPSPAYTAGAAAVPIDAESVPEQVTEVLPATPPGALNPSVPVRRPSGGGRRVRYAAVGVVAAAALAVGIVAATGGGLSRDGRAAPAPSASAASLPGAPAPTSTTVGAVPPYSAMPSELAPPENWGMYRGEGFKLNAPVGWQIVRSGTTTEFREGVSGRRLAVEVINGAGKDALAGVQKREAAWAAGGNGPAQYRQDSLKAVSMFESGADWKYSYQDPSGQRLRVLCRWFIKDGRGFVVSWTSPAYDLSEDYFDIAIGSIRITSP
jgi:serine/threonine protein kinase